ncbi:hypothetical protein KNJ79_19590 [Sphingopyxis indica]|uniref:hypothetical protein n=1 Tax=Sphingopyxis indica TaxID=436663 RepID=UPI00293929AC|nr:hypothetical protein [Sphingopyxis indica]WOF45549.1 hypothetical protein KNJ79_19590 [Sphingopyxis indica]
MARTLEQERAALETEEKRLGERRRRLEEREREQAIGEVEKSGLLRIDAKRLGGLLARIRALGIDEVEKRLAV